MDGVLSFLGLNNSSSEYIQYARIGNIAFFRIEAIAVEQKFATKFMVAEFECPCDINDYLMFTSSVRELINSGASFNVFLSRIKIECRLNAKGQGIISVWNNRLFPCAKSNFPADDFSRFLNIHEQQIVPYLRKFDEAWRT
jgi:hypothetical protein